MCRMVKAMRSAGVSRPSAPAILRFISSLSSRRSGPGRGSGDLYLVAFLGVRMINDLVCLFCLHLRLSRIQEVKRAIHRDPVNPRAEVRPELKTLQAFVSPQKRFLDELFCILLITGHAVDHAKDAAGMAFDQNAECVPVAGQDLRHYCCICNFHSINLDRN